MKLYPYSTIQTEKLKLLLISARVLGLLSFVLFFGAIVVGVLGFLMDQPTTFDMGGGMTGTLSAPGTTAPALFAAIWGIVSSICILAFSGLCAAVVSCEYKYTSASD